MGQPLCIIWMFEIKTSENIVTAADTMVKQRRDRVAVGKVGIGQDQWGAWLRANRRNDSAVQFCNENRI